MSTFVNSVAEAKNRYSNISFDNLEPKTKIHKNKKYTLYGRAHIKYGLCGKINRIFKFCCSMLLIPLTCGLILKSKSFTKSFVKNAKTLTANEEFRRIFVLDEGAIENKVPLKIKKELARSLELEDITPCLKIADLEQYITVCEAITQKFQKVEDILVQSKLDAMLKDIVDKFRQQQRDIHEIKKIQTAIYERCSTLQQLLYIMQFNLENQLLDGYPLKKIVKLQWMEEFVARANLLLVSKCLENCDDFQIYFKVKNEFIKQNKFDLLLLQLGEREKNLIEIVNEAGFQFPTQVDFKFHTQIFDKQGNPIVIAIYDMHKKHNGYPVYELRSNEERIGSIAVGDGPDGFVIFDMQNLSVEGTEKKFKNVGFALHEFAASQSFAKGFNGNVRLNANNNSDAFHFICGYRYENPLALIFDEKFDKNLRRHIEDYFEAKKNNQPLLEILNLINQHKDEYKESYNQLKANAKKFLKRDPIDLQEIIEMGSCFDKNMQLEKSIEQDPFNHPQLGPLFKEYKAAKEKQRPLAAVLQNIQEQMDWADPALEKFFNKMEKNATIGRGRKSANLTELIDFVLNYRPVYSGGWMRLSEEKIKHWKQLFNI